VIAKPAEQTPLIAALAVKLCHEAGIPPEAFQLLPGAGEVGQLITADPRLAGVAFTGSTETARAINRALANRDGPIATLIAETGGQNAMIVDSSALPEQVVRDVLASAFQSAGQRCSALRVLYLQEDIADPVLEMIRGGFEALSIGDPAELTTDVGPVIDAEAQGLLEAHVAACAAGGHKVTRLPLPPECAKSSFVAPTIIEIGSIADLARENFGPVLHVVRFKAGAKERNGRIVVGKTFSGDLVRASDLMAGPAMTAVLQDALMPNLAQTREGGPVISRRGSRASSMSDAREPAPA
jgi:RHH-type proline utilization regulon transcriptional repressor/proline dehydrogenase/delta 1-pyrroline-5-carboxylate dehydrogenase